MAVVILLFKRDLHHLIAVSAIPLVLGELQNCENC